MIRCDDHAPVAWWEVSDGVWILYDFLICFSVGVSEAEAAAKTPTVTREEGARSRFSISGQREERRDDVTEKWRRRKGKKNKPTVSIKEHRKATETRSCFSQEQKMFTTLSCSTSRHTTRPLTSSSSSQIRSLAQVLMTKSANSSSTESDLSFKICVFHENQQNMSWWLFLKAALIHILVPQQSVFCSFSATKTKNLALKEAKEVSPELRLL